MQIQKPSAAVGFGRLVISRPDIQAQPNVIGSVAITGNSLPTADVLEIGGRDVARSPKIKALSQVLEAGTLDERSLAPRVLEALDLANLTFIPDDPEETFVGGKMRADYERWFRQQMAQKAFSPFLASATLRKTDAASLLDDAQWVFEPA